MTGTKSRFGLRVLSKKRDNVNKTNFKMKIVEIEQDLFYFLFYFSRKKGY